MDIVFARETVVVAHPDTGASVGVIHGTHWPADDPVVKAYSHFFTSDARFGLSSSRPLGDDGYPVDTSAKRSRSAVETTTAEPGQKRNRK